MPETLGQAIRPPQAALVTGGGGFLGRAIVERLLARAIAVRILARGDYPDLAAAGGQCMRGDIRDAQAVRKACAGCDLVFHVAAKAGLWGSYASYYDANVRGTENVIAACRAEAVSRLVFTSSPSVVFDKQDMEGVDESLPYPDEYLHHYPRSKAVAERLVLAANSLELRTVALRPHLMWGPRDNHLLPRLAARAASLRRLGRINKLVDSTYIDDAAEAHMLAAERLQPGSPVAGRAYFISQGEPWPTWDLINGLLGAAGLPPVTRARPRVLAECLAVFLEAAHTVFRLPGEPRLTRFAVNQLCTARWFDISAARRDLGYQPCVSIAQGLDRLRTWLQEDKRMAK